MRITALDHIVLNVADVERSLEFYAGKLGLQAERVDQWRKREVGFPSVRVNEHTIIDLLAHAPSGDNVAHFCLVAEGPMEAIQAHLAAQGIEVHEGPGTRSGARGNATSVYIRDPDSNTVELRCY